MRPPPLDPLDVRRTRSAESNATAPLRGTGSQTAGPYVHIGCLPNWIGIHGIYPSDLRSHGKITGGSAIRIVGRVFDGENVACKDAMLEIWQANQHGDFLKGIWRRAPTDLVTGEFVFETVRPGAVHDPDGGTLAPFISVWIVARGFNVGLNTRLYFPEDGALHATDPHLALVPEARRWTLIATPTGQTGEYRFDIHLQGAAETIFFAG